MLLRSDWPDWAELWIHVSSGFISNIFQMFLNLLFLSLLNSHSVFLSCQQGELEKLNQSTDDINRWETELEVGLGCFNSHCAIVFLEWLLQEWQKGRPFFQTRPGFSHTFGLSGLDRGNHLSMCFGNPLLCSVSSGSNEFYEKQQIRV